jgi:Ca2+-binding EF-hand superfamily protein
MALKKLCVKLGLKQPDFELNETAATAAMMLGFTNGMLTTLKRQFDRIDLDGSGEIDYEEFCDFIDEPRTAYSDALFKMIDTDESGQLSFNEFVGIATLYCSYSKDDVLTYAFNTFDTDASGTIDEVEFMNLAKMINNGNPMFPGNFGRALAMFDKNDDGLLDRDEFRDIDRRFPMMLFPAFRLQDRLQRNTLGDKTWIMVIERLAWNDHSDNYAASHNGRKPRKPLGQALRHYFGLPGKPFVQRQDDGGVAAEKKRKREERKAKRKGLTVDAGAASSGSSSKSKSGSKSPKGKSPKGRSPKGSKSSSGSGSSRRKSSSSSGNKSRRRSKKS